jgi:hypothetical protein
VLTDRLKARAKDQGHPDPSRLAAAFAKTDGACLASFVKAETLGDCPAAVDAAYECGRPIYWDGWISGALVPVCGDGMRYGAEECDGQDNAACPGRCRTDCTCAQLGPGVCGDGIVNTGETCDGTQRVDCSSYAPFCAAPGTATECQCCATGLCGGGAECCPGLTCMPTGGPGLLYSCQ